MKSKIFFSIVFLLIFFTFFQYAECDIPESDEYIIDGSDVYIDTPKAYIRAPGEIYGTGWTHLNFISKQYSGDIDLALGFDTTHLKPKKAEFYNPHLVEWTTDHEQTFYNVAVYDNYSGEHLDYGNDYNSIKRIIEHDIPTYDENLNVNGTITVWSNISFDTFDNTNLPDTASIYWHTEHSRIENWIDITDKFGVLPESIHNNYDNKNKWYYVKDQPITAGTEYQIRIYVSAPPQVGEYQYKYDVVIKPSGQTFAQANNNGNLFVLDPYFNTSFSNVIFTTITTDGSSTPTSYQKLLNISYESEMQADFDDIRFTDSSNNELSYFLVSKVDSNYAIVRVELSDAITDPGSDTIRMYFGNADVSSGSVGVDTFLSFFDGDSTGWTEVDPNGHIAFTNNRLDFAGLTRNEDAYVYQSNANINGDVVLEYSIYITSFVSSGFAGFGVLGDIIDDWNGMDNGFQTSRAYSTPNLLNMKRIADAQTIGDNTVSFSTGTQYWMRSTIDRSGNMVSIVYSDSDRTSQVGSSMTVDASDVSATLNYIYLLNAFNSGDSDRSATGWIDDFSVRKYIANEPTASYGDSHFYTDSLHYNTTSPYNHTIESDATLTANRSITAADDTDDTAKSTGTSHLIINVFDNEASIVRNFTFTGDDLDWYQAANLSGSYDLKNAGGIIETQSDGNFTTNLAPGTYWIEETIPEYIPPNPITLENTAGNFWVNFTWSPGSGNVTDNYNVSYNGTWDNTSSNAFRNESVGAHGHLNITVYAYNNSGDGTLSAGYITDNVTVPNNVPVLSGVSASYNLYENETLIIDAEHIDLDGDTITYSDNASEWDINSVTGEVSWGLDWGDVGVHPYRITINDGHGGTDYQDFTVTVTGMQNTALTSVDTSFDNGTPGSDFTDNTITLSFYLINSGSIDADVSAKFITNQGAVFGLVDDGSSIIPGSNFKLGNSTLDALLDNGNSVDLTDDVPGEDTQINYEVQLRVPAGQSALAYSGTIELTFSDAI